MITVQSLKYTIVGLLLAFPAIAREKDLRTATDSVGQTEISFCSRPSPNSFGFPGHAFVAFSEKKPGEPRTFRAIGQTVAAGTSIAATAFSYFGGTAVAGNQGEEMYTSVKQACMTVIVDRVAYNKAVDAARPTLTRLGIPGSVAASAESYELNGNDCIDFAIRVARTLESSGLIVPTRSPLDTPTQYIQELISANP